MSEALGFEWKFKRWKSPSESMAYLQGYNSPDSSGLVVASNPTGTDSQP